ncbi:trypsin-5-like isoform X2 [Agrilus planipennis]|uniref:Trypsin-5-like isoform X2 n=1 Tax=Agrilus planipennis TaxID=224129 RepID=A0A7F5RLS2_AGRPL|nr:trypsin-5-like isoform X2 [Agrilus planipennis]
MVPLTSYVTIGIFFLFSRIGDSNLSEITPRIINGTFACPGQFPFMLKKHLKLNEFVKQIRLTVRETVYPEGTEGRVMGWGYDIGNPLSASCLQYAEINTFSDDYCGSLYDDNEQISPSLQICAGVSNGGRGSCIGDAGSPFVVKRHQAGINSWSQKPCAFTRVSAYINWIKNKTGLQFEEAPGAV